MVALKPLKGVQPPEKEGLTSQRRNLSRNAAGPTNLGSHNISPCTSAVASHGK